MSQMAAVETYDAPRDLSACLDLLASRDDGLLLAGGMSVVPQLRSRQLRPRALVDLARVAELRGIEATADGLVVGAMVTYREVARDVEVVRMWTALADAAGMIGDRQVQNRGTVGGNIAFGAPTSDITPAAATLGARVRLVSPAGSRTSPVEVFLATPRAIRLGPAEIIASISCPAPAPGSGSAYDKYGITRNGRPVISVGAAVTLDPSGDCIEARLVVGGVGEAPHVVTDELGLAGGRVDDEAITSAAASAAATAPAHDDARGSAAYRRQLAKVYGRRVLMRATVRAKEDAPT